jgi:subtilisin family serine protease
VSRARALAVTRSHGRGHGAWATVAGGALALTLVALATTPAHAQTDDGLWYVRDTGVADAHATTTGRGVTVAVIDSPINPDVPELADADLSVRDEAFCDADGDGTMDPATSTGPEAEHGTTMTSIIVGSGEGADGQPGVQGVAPGATVLYYAWESGDPDACNASDVVGVAEAVDQAVADGAQILNLSIGGVIPSAEETAAIGRAIRAGAVVVASAGNEVGAAREWPGLTNGVVTVTGLDAEQNLNTGSEIYGPTIDVVAPGVDLRTHDGADWATYDLGTGTSLATAWTSGVLALAWSAHPDATGNQMIQSLLRNTTSGGGELTRADDYWGYAIVWVRRMPEADPPPPTRAPTRSSSTTPTPYPATPRWPWAVSPSRPREPSPGRTASSGVAVHAERALTEPHRLAVGDDHPLTRAELSDHAVGPDDRRPVGRAPVLDPEHPTVDAEPRVRPRE